MLLSLHQITSCSFIRSQESFQVCTNHPTYISNLFDLYSIQVNNWTVSTISWQWQLCTYEHWLPYLNPTSSTHHSVTSFATVPQLCINKLDQPCACTLPHTVNSTQMWQQLFIHYTCKTQLQDKLGVLLASYSMSSFKLCFLPYAIFVHWVARG